MLSQSKNISTHLYSRAQHKRITLKSILSRRFHSVNGTHLWRSPLSSSYPKNSPTKVVMFFLHAVSPWEIVAGFAQLGGAVKSWCDYNMRFACRSLASFTLFWESEILKRSWLSRIVWWRLWGSTLQVIWWWPVHFNRNSAATHSPSKVNTRSQHDPRNPPSHRHLALHVSTWGHATASR